MLEIRDNFYLNGEPFKIISGAFHYFRTVPEYWQDRIEKLVNMGCNTVETYIPWNFHEPEKGNFRFDGMHDIERFIHLAEKMGLYIIIRPSPYICSEWEFGGLPAWLLRDRNMRLRCSYEPYLNAVKEYYSVLIPKLVPHQCDRGGGVILVQLENEYGYYGNDTAYLEFLRDTLRELGVTVPFVTSDGPWSEPKFKSGMLNGALPTGNFGSGAEWQFGQMRKYIGENKPLMCMEFWNGWFDHWGEEHHTRGSDSVAGEIKDFLDIDASFNFYMFHGGTNFGFTAGANCYEEYQPTVTSYDYCALLTEWGDYTPAYYAVRELLLKAQNLPETELPASPELQTIGKVELDESTSLMSNFDNLGEHHRVPLPESMEYFGQNSGMIYYETKLEQIYDPRELRVANVHDTAYVYIDGEHKATIDRRDENKIAGYDTFKFDGCTDGCTIGVLVDAMGRVNYGEHLYDRKGIDAIRYGNQNLMGYDVVTLPLDNPEKIDFSLEGGKYPLFMRGHFKAQSQKDCFVHLDGFKKGCVYINGFNIGRYWEIGPQRALYIPGVLLKDENEIIILELEGCEKAEVEITAEPDLG